VQGQSQSVGRYELREEIGAGGFATVYRAYDPTLDRAIALKLLHLHLARDAATRERFVREGRALARVRHPNIVQVYDAGEAAGTAYLAMELIEGRPLSEIVAKRGALPLMAVAEIAEQVAGALAAVHARNLVHRDVKPVNIMIETESGRAVLLDLGIARVLDAATMTLSGWFVGTPGFMAPEQLQSGREITPRTDVYQLGATVYTLLAGRPPFEGTTLQVVNAIVSKPPPYLGDLRPDLPPAVIGVIAEAMAKDPARRPAGTREFAAQLRDAAGVTPSPARSPSVTEAGRTAAPTVVVTPAPAPAAPPYGATGTVGSAAGAAAPPGPFGGAVPPPVADTPAQRFPAGAGAAAWSGGGAPPVPDGRPRAAADSPPYQPPAAPGWGGGVPTALPTPARGPERARGRGTLPLFGIGALAAAVVAGIIIFFAMSATGGGTSGGTETGGGTTTPAVAPVVANLKVYDSPNKARADEFEVGDSVAACFTLTSGSDRQTLAVVMTPNSTELPQSPNDQAVVGRADPVPQRNGEGCYTVKVLKTPLAPGKYWISVFHGNNRLGTASFTAKPRPGDVLVRDDFNDPSKSILSTSTSDPQRFRFRFDKGEYVIEKLDPQFTRFPLRELPDTYTNAGIAVDAYLAGDTAGRFVGVACRSSSAGDYLLVVDPAQGRFALFRRDNESRVALVDWQQSAPVKRNNAVNRLELNCVGDTITAFVNGVQVATKQDSTYKSGAFWIGAGSFTESPNTVEGRFDNLVVTQR
jgi:hypothetical protein